MSDANDQLPRQESDRILYEQIIPDLHLHDASSYEHPKAIIVVGQPGACAAQVSRGLFAELQGDVILIEPGELADYHPRVREFRREGYTWNARTNADATAWAVRLLVHAAELRKNLILDTSFTDGGLLNPVLIGGLRARGYELDVRVVSATGAESEFAIGVLFSNGMFNEGYGRYISKTAHDTSYALLPERLEAIQSGAIGPSGTVGG